MLRPVEVLLHQRELCVDAKDTCASVASPAGWQMLRVALEQPEQL